MHIGVIFFFMNKCQFFSFVKNIIREILYCFFTLKLIFSTIKLTLYLHIRVIIHWRNDLISNLYILRLNLITRMEFLYVSKTNPSLNWKGTENPIEVRIFRLIDKISQPTNYQETCHNQPPIMGTFELIFYGTN